MTALKKNIPPDDEAMQLVDSRWADKVNVITCCENMQEPPKEFDPANNIVVCDAKGPEYILNLAVEKGVKQIVQKDCFEYEKELNTSALMLSDQNLFINSPISSILSPQKAGAVTETHQTLIKIEFKSAVEKRGLLQAVSDQLEVVVKSGNLKSDVLSVADELITNAIYNAPYMDLENKNPGALRSDPTIQMGPGKNGAIFVGCDDSRLVIGCHDPYGTLNILNLLTRVRNCYTRGVAENINMDSTAGAGIGTYMVYNASSGYYAATREGLVTLVCCTVPIKMSGRRRATVSKNLHYFNL